MGLAKSEWMEAQERGWEAPEKSVCPDCVDDDHLKAVIRRSLTSLTCDYCGREEKTEIAAAVEEIMPSVMGALGHHFSSPENAGVPYETAEGGWLIEPTDTQDALMSLPFDCNDELFEDISRAISEFNDAWVEAADGSWAGEHENARLIGGWNAFADYVKHRQRYFFTQTPDEEFGPDIDPSRLLHALGDVVSRLALIQNISANTVFFRVRAKQNADAWPRDKNNLAAPPPAKAAAGRMNPPGISYLYLALEKPTAIAEVALGPPCSFVIAQFIVDRDLTILSLTNFPAIPSIFDHERLSEMELLLFLTAFTEKISQPVMKDGSEHVEYVPSQVVCEYFASVFKRDGVSLDGILYPSAVRPGGRNLVLFPQHDSAPDKFPEVNLQDATEVTAENCVK